MHNLSYVLPSLMEASLPTARSQLNSLLFIEPEDYDNDTFNQIMLVTCNFWHNKFTTLEHYFGDSSFIIDIYYVQNVTVL